MNPALRTWMAGAIVAVFASPAVLLAWPEPARAGAAAVYGVNNPAADRLVGACAAQVDAFLGGPMSGRPPEETRQDKIIMIGSYLNASLSMSQADAHASLPMMRDGVAKARNSGDPFAEINNALVLCLVEHVADPSLGDGSTVQAAAAPPPPPAAPAFQGNGPLTGAPKPVRFAGSDASDCIDPPTYGPGPNAWTELTNHCSYPVEAAWCVEGVDCKNGYPGSAPIRPGQGVQVKGAVDGSGRHVPFHRAACRGLGSMELYDEGYDYHCILTDANGAPVKAGDLKK